ncbi:MAG: NTP transferase domain-containing protein [candidate division Zixibacteria bacterium]|nr:NTP transferase domain-containing protein [candidate division Zixibacteria bacterium]
MKILIPAAGQGLRLRPHTLNRPKPLLRLAGKTVLDHLMEPLLKLSPSELILVWGHLGAVLIEHFRTNYDVPLTAVEQDRVLGLGYAVHLGLKDIDLDEDLLILLSDTVVITDFAKFVSAGENTMALRAVDDPRRFGVAQVDGTRITELVEKPAEPKSNLAVVGLYYFKHPRKLKAALELLLQSGTKTSGEMQLTDALASMIKQGDEFTAFEIDQWLDCGTRETMLETNGLMLKERRSETNHASASTIDENTWIDPSAQISDSTIGPDVTIYEKCQITSSTLKNCIVGPGCEIIDSDLVDSIIGENVILSRQTGQVDIGDCAVSSATS